MQKLLGVYITQLSTYSRCQTLYRSKCTEKNCCKSRGHVPQCPIADDANELLYTTVRQIQESIDTYDYAHEKHCQSESVQSFFRVESRQQTLSH